ncbi:MAG: glucokinase, partial [Lachnospiraceae bacterium]|nr:glucokinase [Lachnospiraceae bacterium]
GPGTGLGMGYLLKDEESEFYTIGSSEGGHQDYTAKGLWKCREKCMKDMSLEQKSFWC